MILTQPDSKIKLKLIKKKYFAFEYKHKADQQTKFECTETKSISAELKRFYRFGWNAGLSIVVPMRYTQNQLLKVIDPIDGQIYR